MRWTGTASAMVALGGLLTVGLLSAAWWSAARLPKRFAVVDRGRLYRSGSVLPGHLARLQRQYGIGRVVSLLDPNAPVSRAEQEAATALGLEWYNVPLPGNGASTPGQRQRLRDLLLDADGPPTLVHCAAGVNRTGLAVGLYRIHAQGWSPAEILAEMRTFDFEDEPAHENLRQALRNEAAGATGSRSH